MTSNEVEVKVLEALEHAAGPQSAQDVANALRGKGVSEAAISTAILRLIDREIIHFTPEYALRIDRRRRR